jgi:hypothetical protein
MASQSSGMVASLAQKCDAAAAPPTLEAGRCPAPPSLIALGELWQPPLRLPRAAMAQVGKQEGWDRGRWEDRG